MWEQVFKLEKKQFDSSDNSCNLIGQHLVLLFILTFDWLMESIQIFLRLDGLFKAEVNVQHSNLFEIWTVGSNTSWQSQKC